MSSESNASGHASASHDHGHGGHGHGPKNFWTKYVFSTDHKVIGLQFTFASLLFVVLGGLLALGVRYQIAWPMQDVPYAKLLPGGLVGGKNTKTPRMTAQVPEANVAFWTVGEQVELRKAMKTDSGQEVPAKAMVTLKSLPKGLAVTLPAGTRIQSGPGEMRTLDEPMPAFVDPNLVMGDYSYKGQFARAVAGITVRTGADFSQEVTLLGSEVWMPGPDGSAPLAQNSTEPLRLPVLAPATPLELAVPAVLKDRQGNELATLSGPASLSATAADASFYKNQLSTDAYLSLFTMHASIMIFFVIIPMLVGGFGNFLIPLMIGARDMAFPKLNMLAFWISVPIGVIMLVSLWVPGGAAGGGWTMYPTLSEKGFVASDLGTTLWVFGVAVVGFSSIVGAINYITTIVNMRAPGMHMFRMPLTVWSLFITAILQLFATPVLTAAMILLLLDRTMGTMFFQPDKGGQPLMWQHLFWFYSHPAVYIMILPGMGLVSDVIAVHARKAVFGYKPMVFAISGIAGLGFIVWGHHMFQSGMNPVLGATFMASTMMIGLPSAIKTFNWLGTIWGGNIRFTPAMLNALGFVSMFVVGGLSGLFMASAPVDIHIHDTYFIVAHIHYVLFGGSIFAIFAGIYHWFPKMFGRQMNQRWGVIHFVMTIIAFNGTFFLMHILGVGGHPRRYASIMEYPTLEHLQPMNVIMTLFAMSMGMAQLPFFFNFFASMPRKLSRGVAAAFAVALTTPMVIGSLFYSDRLLEMAEKSFANALALSIAAGLAWAVLCVLAVFALWFLTHKWLPMLIAALLYPLCLPMFLMPIVLKHDTYLFLSRPGLYAWRWVILGLLVLPGLAYLLVVRPRDEYGAIPEENPWKANSLEWATTSPPPLENFPAIPTVYRGPYEFGSPVVEEDYLPQERQLPAGVVEPAGH